MREAALGVCAVAFGFPLLNRIGFAWRNNGLQSSANKRLFRTRTIGKTYATSYGTSSQNPLLTNALSEETA
jgi:hypothetical protein